MRRYADVQWYNDTWSSWAFPLTAEPAKINQLMAYLCSETHGSGMFRYFADWATDTHTYTHWHCGNTHKHTPKKTQNGDQQWSTMINIHHHVLLLLLISPRISSYSLWSFCLNRFVLILEGQLCGTISTSADSATSIYLYHLESSWVNILLDLGYPSVSTNHGLLDCLSAKMIKNADSLKWKLQRINGRKSDWECDPAILLKQFSFT